VYCPACGTRNDDNNFRCIQCGQVIQMQPGAQPGASPANGWEPAGTYAEPSKANTAFLLSVVGCLVCLAAAWPGYQMGKEELAAIAEGRRDPRNESTARAAVWLAISALAVWVLGGILFALGFAFGAFSAL